MNTRTCAGTTAVLTVGPEIALLYRPRQPTLKSRGGPSLHGHPTALRLVRVWSSGVDCSTGILRMAPINARTCSRSSDFSRLGPEND